MKARWTRRMIGLLRTRLSDPQLDRVRDPRRRSGRWKVLTVLRAVVIAMAAGANSFKDLEALTDEISPPARRALDLARRLPDTTARDMVVRVAPEDLTQALYRQVRAAYRRGSIAPTAFRWGVVSLDGKDTVINAWDDTCAQKQGKRGHLRTITATLVSSDARICVGAVPIPPKTNEMGHYKAALQQLCEAYRGLDLFRVVMYDAGACSESNASFTRAQKLHYVMVLNEAQPTLYAEARSFLGTLDRHAAAHVHTDKKKRVRHTIWLTQEMAGFLNWPHLNLVVRVRREQLDKHGRVTAFGERYFISSLRDGALDGLGWIQLTKSRWGVENNSHHLWDTVFAEDKRTWISTDPIGALNILLLRRIAANLLIIYRHRTLRGEFKRLVPWHDLIRRAYNAIISATEKHLDKLRPRLPPLPEAA
jgi:hypothetical protein